MQLKHLATALIVASATAMPTQQSTEQLPSWLGGLFGGGASKPAASSGGLGGLASLFGGGSSKPAASSPLGDLAQLFGSGPNSLSSITAQLGIKPSDIAQLGSLIKPGDLASLAGAFGYVNL
jgi:uncharacterized protein YidB (DUF937 family)